ncbi:MAG: hypothetical protein U5R06_21965 [candidate division KSB1 bacterium]|nr:hypothetical protein [candidate division KSB1 bacterium]
MRFGAFQRVKLILFFLFVLLTRIPWLTPGYGLDSDAWRVVRAARNIAETGDYTLSRLPGYPLQEYLLSWIGTSAPVVVNGLTAVFSSMACLFFVLILRFFHIKRIFLWGIAFALTPVVYINSVNSMDYMWALAFVLAAVYLVLKDRPVLAGLCLGLAVGCRMTSAAMLLPLAIWLFIIYANKSYVRLLSLAGLALITGVLCYIPVFVHYGIGFLNFYDIPGYPSLATLLGRSVLWVWGVWGAAGLLLMFALALFNRQIVRMSWHDLEKRSGILLCLTTVVIYFAVFLRLPHEAGYLIPVVPFMILGVNLIMRSRYTLGLAIALLLSPFLVSVDRSGIEWTGPVIQDHFKRTDQTHRITCIIAAVNKLKGPAVMVTGSLLPQIQVMTDDPADDEKIFVDSISDREQIESYTSRGADIYVLEEAISYNEQVYQIDLLKLGAISFDSLLTNFKPSRSAQ